MSVLGLSRSMHSLPVPIIVRCYSNSDVIGRRSEVTLRADSVEKVGVSTQPDFFSAVGAIFRCGRGGPHNPPQTQWSEF